MHYVGVYLCTGIMALVFGVAGADVAADVYPGEPYVSWEDTYSAAGPANSGNAVTVDPDGNAVIAAQMDTGSMDIHLLRYFPGGSRSIVAAYDRGLFESPQGVACDLSGNIHVGGYVVGSFMLVLKYPSAGGTTEWEYVRQECSNDTFVYGIGVAADGQVYVTGQNYCQSRANMMVMKLSAAGTTVWREEYGITGELIEGRDIAVMPGGETYVAGVRTDVGSLAWALLAKYDSAGGFSWSRTIGGGFDCYGQAVAADASGNAYIVCDKRITTSTMEYEILKYGSDGTLVWSRTVQAYHAPQDLAVDLDGNLYYCINWTTPSYDEGYQVTKMDPSGNVLWTLRGKKSVAGKDDNAKRLAVDRSGNIYMTGSMDDGKTVLVAKISIERVSPGEGDVSVASNLLDLSAGYGEVVFYIKGDAGKEVVARFYALTGKYMGDVKVVLGADGQGTARYSLEGVDGRKPGPGTYVAVFSGGGVKAKKTFVVKR